MSNIERRGEKKTEYLHTAKGRKKQNKKNKN